MDDQRTRKKTGRSYGGSSSAVEMASPKETRVFEKTLEIIVSAIFNEDIYFGWRPTNKVRLNPEDGSFGTTDGSEVGFTCATFLLVLFNGLKFPLVMMDDWPFRADDANWKKHAAMSYADSAVSDYDPNEPFKRVRPCEIVAAVELGEFPTEQSKVIRRGAEIAQSFIDSSMV